MNKHSTQSSCRRSWMVRKEPEQGSTGEGIMPGYRFGKHPPKHDYRTLRFKNYLMPELAAPPAELNVLARVFDNLHCGDAAKLFPMDGNDRLGDCTIAALAHAIPVYRGLVGHERRIMSERAAGQRSRH